MNAHTAAILAERRHTHAFTLIEMMVVLALIVMVAGLSVPMFNALSGSRGLDGAAQLVQSSLQSARAQAIQSRAIVECRILKPTADDAVRQYRVQVVGTRRHEEVLLPENIVVNADACTLPPEGSRKTWVYLSIRFRPDGSAIYPEDRDWSDKVIVLRDLVNAEQFNEPDGGHGADVPKYYHHTRSDIPSYEYANGVFDKFPWASADDLFSPTDDENGNGRIDGQIYLRIQKHTGRVWVTYTPPWEDVEE